MDNLGDVSSKPPKRATISLWMGLMIFAGGLVPAHCYAALSLDTYPPSRVSTGSARQMEFVRADLGRGRNRLRNLGNACAHCPGS